MILVDKDLRERIQAEPSLIKGYLKDSQLGAVSCDLTVSEVVGSKWEDNRFSLIPQSVVFVKTNEFLQMPKDLIGIVTEKNSRMRQGLRVEAPRYQPGHHTAMFLRVQNISDQTIYLEKDMEIAQIMFESLSRIPEKTYDERDDASYNQETKYRGFGNYEKEYKTQISNFTDTVKEAKEDIESASHRIYSNVLALMGIIVAVFSLITINYNTATQTNVDFRFLIAMNLTLGFCIVLLLGLIFIFVNTRKHKSLWIAYLVILLLLAAAVIAYSFYAFHC